MVSWPFAKRRKSSAVSVPRVAAATTIAEEPRHEFQREEEHAEQPENQSALLLHAVRQPYEHTSDHSIPQVEHDHELLVKVSAVGLNPIDWKAPYVFIPCTTMIHETDFDIEISTLASQPYRTYRAVNFPALLSGLLPLPSTLAYEKATSSQFRRLTIAT
jgi:hypothetical protein